LDLRSGKGKITVTANDHYFRGNYDFGVVCIFVVFVMLHTKQNAGTHRPKTASKERTHKADGSVYAWELMKISFPVICNVFLLFTFFIAAPPFCVFGLTFIVAHTRACVNGKM